MKKTFTPVVAIAICLAAFTSCSKDVKKPVNNVVVSNASTKTGSSTTTTTSTTTQTTNTQSQSEHTCGNHGYGG